MPGKQRDCPGRERRDAHGAAEILHPSWRGKAVRPARGEKSRRPYGRRRSDGGILQLALLFRVAVSAAIGVLDGVAEQEDGVQLGLRHGDAAGVLAVDDVHQLLGQLQVLLGNPLTVADNVDGDVGVDVAQHVQIHLHGRVDLDDVLFAHAVAADVLDDGHGAVQLIQVEVLVDVHALASLDVVQDHAVLDAVDIHKTVSPFLTPGRPAAS